MYELWFKKKQKIQDESKRKFPKRGDVWMCELGENIGSEQNVRRPCLVISNHKNKENTCIVLPASRTKREFSCTIDRYNFLVHQVRTVDTKRLDRFIERLSKKDVDIIVSQFVNFFV